MKYYKIATESFEAERSLDEAINNSLLGLEATEVNDETGSRPRRILGGDNCIFETIYRTSTILSDGKKPWYSDSDRPRKAELELIVNATEPAIANFQKYISLSGEESDIYLKEARNVTRATLITRASDNDEEKINAYKQEITEMPLPAQVIEEKQLVNWNTSINGEADFHFGATYTGNIPEILALQERIKAKAQAHNIYDEHYLSTIKFE